MDRHANATASYDEAAVLAREVGRRMAARLDYVKIQPARLGDFGCATGEGIRELQRRYPRALPLAVDPSLPLLRQTRARTPRLERWRGRAPRAVSADLRQLPVATNVLGLAWSNLALSWLDDPQPALRELQRVLEVGGLLSISLLGPDTLKELRAGADELGIAAPIRRFHDMHDIGDMLVGAGFADPVMDMEVITLTYPGPRGLLADQRHLGVRDALFGRLAWRDWRRLLAHWARRRDGDGRLPASFEVVYGHAWKAAPRTSADGRAIVHFQPGPR